MKKLRRKASVRRQRGALMMYVALAAGVLILVLGLALKAEKSSHKATKAEYAAFVSNVKTIGEAAEAAAVLKTAADKKSKETADAENKRTTDSLRADIRRLRSARSGGGLVPPAPAGSSSPDLAAFNRAELELALRNFEIGIEGLLTEGDEAIVNLNSSKSWAQEMK